MLIKLSLIVFSLAFTAFSQNLPPIEPGVSQELAKWRAARYSDIRYKLNLTLEKMSPVLKGTIEIRVKLSEPPASAGGQSAGGTVAPIILDWRKIKGHEEKSTVANVSLNGKLVSVATNWPPADAGGSDFSEHLIFRDGVINGENVIKLDFTSPILTSGSAITRYIDKEDGSEYIYSLFVPSDASTAFPVFDQPDLKARFTLNLSTPRDWTAVSNSIASSEKWQEHWEVDEKAPADPKSVTLLNWWTIDFGFGETKPISTYVFAFAAGPFERVSEPGAIATGSATLSNANVTKNQVATAPRSDSRAAQHSDIYVRKSQAAKFKPHAAEVFRLNREAVKFFEQYFDYKFPFPKYDLVLIPEFPFGGMEHAGATFLRESAIIFPQEPTRSDHISRALLIFHEASHQWFGDTVTMRWFDDLWLKEGFATFTAYKALEQIMPEMNAWKVFYERVKQAAYQTDSTKGTTAIYQPIANLSAAKSAYGNIVYNKAPAFLRQAEFYLGEDKFQTAVRAFLKKHEFGNAGWGDLVNEFQNASWLRFASPNREVKVIQDPEGREYRVDRYFGFDDLGSSEKRERERKSRESIASWANHWITRRGLSIVKIKPNLPSFNAGSPMPVSELFGRRYVLSQSNALDEKPLSDLTFEMLFRYGALENTLSGKLTRKEKTAEYNYGSMAVYPDTRAKLDGPSTFVFLNFKDFDYGIFLLDDKSRDHVLKNIQNEKDPFLRSMMWGALWDSVREGELDPRVYVELAIKNLPTEKDETMVSSILSRVSTAMNYYVSDASRAKLAPRFEALLIEGMQKSSTLGQRITFYRAFLSIAASENARTVLKAMLKSEPPAFLPLKTKDRFDIVTRLLILSDADGPKLLAELEKTETSDDAKRYAYAARAGIGTAENKAKYWNDFVNNKDISESWIEAAFGTWNSTRHSELTLPYLQRALQELPNHKRGRKIFFVNGWLGAFIGGQRDQQALDIVNKFLADTPNLDNDLRLKILENVDTIERAVKIRNKYKN